MQDSTISDEVFVAGIDDSLARTVDSIGVCESETQSFESKIERVLSNSVIEVSASTAKTDSFLSKADKTMQWAQTLTEESGSVIKEDDNQSDNSTSHATSSTPASNTTDYIATLKLFLSTAESDEERQKRRNQEELEFNEMMSSFGA